MKPNITMRHILDRLAAEDMKISNDAQFVLPAQPPNQSPWYVRLFSGFGAWMAAILMVFFMVAVEIIGKNEILNLGFGVGFCVIAVILYHYKQVNFFIEQFAFALSLVGQIVAGIGFAMIFEEIIPTALAMIVLECVLIGLYPDQFHRFLGYLVMIGALLFISFDINEFTYFPGIIVGLAFTVMFLVLNEYRQFMLRWWNIWHPARYALTIGVLFLPLYMQVFDFVKDRYWITTGLILVACSAGIVWVIRQSLDEMFGKYWYWALAVLGLGIAFLSIYVPGIAAALLIVLLGFWRDNRIMLALAMVALIYYLGAYYTTIQTSLLMKSGILTLSGLIVLIARFVAVYGEKAGE